MTGMRALGVILVANLSAILCTAQKPAADIPAALQPPAGEQLVLTAHATGKQIYTCNTGADGKYSWTLKGPSAKLRDASGKVVIEHSAGPKWQHNDGSSVAGKPVQKMDAPDGKGIPWLLLAAESSSSSGILSRVNFIQRIHTEGGQPPTTGCDESHKDAQTDSNYAADYLFYQR